MHSDKELQKFLDKTPGFEPDTEWVSRLDRAQKDIREFIGGKSKSLTIEMEDVYLGLPEHETKKIYDYFCRVMPEYIQQYNIAQSEFENPGIKRRKKSNRSGKVNDKVISWGKHIRFWCDKNEKYPYDLHDMVSNMGELYAMYKNKKMQLTFTITTHPIAYASLGSLGEYRSCFRQGSENPHHKYVLGQTPGSFVILVTHDPIEVDYDTLMNADILGRLWGFYDNSNGSFCFCNWYPKKCNIINSLLSGLRQGLQEWLPDHKLISDNSYMPTIAPDRSIWHNNRGNSNQEINWCAYNPTQTNSATVTWNSVQGNMNKNHQTSCPQCGRRFHVDSRFLDSYTGEYMCYKCEHDKETVVSDYSGEESKLASIVHYIDDDGKIKKAFSNEIIEDTGFAEGYGIITSISKNKLTFEKFGKRIFNKQINKSARVRFKDTSHYFIYTKEVESQIKELGNSIDVKENVDYGYSEGKLTII